MSTTASSRNGHLVFNRTVALRAVSCMVMVFSLACRPGVPARADTARGDHAAADSATAAASDSARAITTFVIRALARGDTAAVRPLFFEAAADDSTAPKDSASVDSTAMDTSYDQQKAKFLPAFRLGHVDLRTLRAEAIDAESASAYSTFWILERDLGGAYVPRKLWMHVLLRHDERRWRVLYARASVMEVGSGDGR